MQKGNWRYDIIEAGYKCNMTDIMASIGLVELSRYDETIARRKELTENYNKAFERFNWALLPPSVTPSAETCYHLYALRINGCSEAQRDAIMQKMFDKDIAVNMHFLPVPMLSFYKNLGYQITDYPVAHQTCISEISLPLFYNLTDEQQQFVISSLQEAVAEVLKK